MADLPRITGEEAIRAFEKAGFCVARKKGSHRILKKPDCRFNLSIPVHGGKTIGLGLLKSQIDASGLTVAEFINLLK